ncbi:MAG: TIM barrel protein [Clostridia bacterium]|nr:TIM barrel protein [Clostridia bacterium]MBR3862185.1 TIM barrel protein [Clostridia bacterium]
MRKHAIFGPGGNSESFYAAGYKSTTQAPAYLAALGLGAYEFEAGNGLNAGEKTLCAIGEEARKYGIELSLHTPYFISLSGVDPEKRLKSVGYIERSLAAAAWLGADTIVVHCGSAAKISREEAMSLAKDTLTKTLEAVGDTPIHIGLETMGKINQLGTLDEMIELCMLDRHLYPVVDFGHMNARERGGYFPDSDSYRRIFDKVAEKLGDEKARYMHCHFSKIEFTDAGEKRHLTFADTVYGPHFEPLAKALVTDGLCPRIICESAGTMTEDALFMQAAYNRAAEAK